MRFATIFTLGIAIVSTSASLLVRQTIPSCYYACVAEADISGCSSSADTKCLCDDSTYVSETVKCLEETCQGADLGNAIAVGESICLAAGSTLTVAISITVPTSTSASALPTIAGLKAAAVHDANLNTFVGLAAAGLVALAIY